jgi:hypothetical protein
MSRPFLLRVVLAGMAVVGAAGTAGAFLYADRDRCWTNFLVWFLFLLTVGLGSLFTVALNRLVGARWSVPLRRAPERIASLVVLAAPLALLALLSLHVLYPWTLPEAAHNPVLVAKSAWLNVPFFVARVIVCVTLWLVFFALLVRGSMKQDRTRDPAYSVRAKRLAPIFIAVFALTLTVVSFDWISSMEPEWYSDMFGVYLFVGTFLAGLAASTLAVLHLRAAGRLPGIRADHLYNLGGLMFAFTVFWAYIGFAQYMLIWYADMPEEVVWYQRRIDGSWLGVALGLALAHFLVPFFLLLARSSKSHPRTLGIVSLVVLGAHWLDLYWMVFPVLGKPPVFGWPELSFALLFFSVGLAWVRRSMGWGADLPVGDPLLAEGLEFHV